MSLFVYPRPPSTLVVERVIRSYRKQTCDIWAYCTAINQYVKREMYVDNVCKIVDYRLKSGSIEGDVHLRA